ncbi:MAG: alpha-glucosidase [Pseudonocardiales bacterium]|nr:alpha-glucosidase [Pseudonocardiales bacterium]
MTFSPALPRTTTNGAVTVESPQWWRSSVIYQLYVRSFADSDGDGIGDLDGITAHLDHLASLGVDGLWLNPCYPSPNRDGGYDVSDYLTIDSRYGGMPAFQRLLKAAHDRGLKLLLDLVPNHCSDQHEWFIQALQAKPGSPQRDRFLFADGRGPDGSEPPNNWRSTFGGPAWTQVAAQDGAPGQWYLHSFDTSQPDFNWENHEVVEMFDDVLRTWFDRGIDGFRIDVAYAMVKAAGLPDLADPDAENPHLWNQPGVHDIFSRWRAIADSYDRELTLLGEVWLSPTEVADYIREGELKQVFYFDLLQQPFDAAAFRQSIAESLAGLDRVEGSPAWALNSHDVHRAVTRYGLIAPEPIISADANALRTRARGEVDLQLGVARATAAALLMLALPGSVYLYQGEELGLPEVQDLPDEARQDPIWLRSHGTEHGRDGSRVPLPWAAGQPAFGFSSGSTWLAQPDWFANFTVEQQQADEQSVLALYRKALRVRRSIDQANTLDWLDTGRADVLAFRRGDFINVTVFGGAPFAVPADWGTEALCSQPLVDRQLPADTSGWFRRFPSPS